MKTWRNNNERSHISSSAMIQVHARMLHVTITTKIFNTKHAEKTQDHLLAAFMAIHNDPSNKIKNSYLLKTQRT